MNGNIIGLFLYYWVFILGALFAIKMFNVTDDDGLIPILIVLTGGGALLKNLDKRLKLETGMPIIVADDPLSSVVLGSGQALDNIEILREIAIE